MKISVLLHVLAHLKTTFLFITLRIVLTATGGDRCRCRLHEKGALSMPVAWGGGPRRCSRHERGSAVDAGGMGGGSPSMPAPRGWGAVDAPGEGFAVDAPREGFAGVRCRCRRQKNQNLRNFIINTKIN